MEALLNLSKARNIILQIGQNYYGHIYSKNLRAAFSCIGTVRDRFICWTAKLHFFVLFVKEKTFKKKGEKKPRLWL